MRLSKRIAALALVAGALLASGCGSDSEGDPIPAATAQEMERELDAVQAQILNETPEDCQGIEDQSMPALQDSLDSLPDSVDSDVRSALEESLAHLQDLVNAKCSRLQTDTETETTPTETVTVETETTPKTETETTPTETTPTTEGQTNTQDNGTGGTGDGAGQGGGTTSPEEGGGD